MNKSIHPLVLAALGGLWSGLTACDEEATPSPDPAVSSKPTTVVDTADQPAPAATAVEPTASAAATASAEATASAAVKASTDPKTAKAPRTQVKAADCCAGKNDCKGRGGCKTSKNECAGKNECKALGGCGHRPCG